MVWQVDVYVKPLERAALLSLNLLDVEWGKHLTTHRMLHMRQRQEARWKEILLTNLSGCHGGQALPDHSWGSLMRTPCCTGFRPPDIMTPSAGRELRS